MTSPILIARHRTAIARPFLSRPVARALDDTLITSETSVFDYGCGRGTDIRHLRQMGIDASGWDPAFAAAEERRPADVVNLGYVINVIEDRTERVDALTKAWALAQSALVVSARLHWEAEKVAGRPHGDGVITATGTFQKFYTQEELRGWIESTLGVKPVAAAPGIFYVFRSPQARQRLLAQATRSGRSDRRQAFAQLIYEQHSGLLSPLERWVADHSVLPDPTDLPGAREIVERFGSIRSAFTIIRRAVGPDSFPGFRPGPSRRSEQRYEQNLDLLQPLIDFLNDRGRLPHAGELAAAPQIEDQLGSLRGAFSLIRKVTGPQRWQRLEETARNDFLVYLALAALERRPRFSDLPPDLEHDARDFFGSYKTACAAADQLLFGAGDATRVHAACASSPLGKVTPEALYIHVSALGALDPLLRVYEGCGRALSGTVLNATILKLHRLKPQVSYLIYPDFDTDPHPALAASVIARLRSLHVDYRGFAESANPPILHRKDLLVSRDYPQWGKFARLSEQEARLGLLDDPAIGTRREWNQRLSELGVRLHGHRVVRTHG